MASSPGGSRLWVRAWLGAIGFVAWRRLASVWGTLVLTALVVMGPTALTPRGLVMVLASPIVGAFASALWLALVHPTARILLRSEAASFLRSLPSPRGAALLPLALVGLTHLPVVALLAAGSGLAAAGGALALATTASVALAYVRLPVRRRREVRWASPGAGLRAVMVRRLLADEALLRALAFAALAGGGAGLLVRNNQLEGAEATALGLAALLLLGAPAYASVLLPIAVVHRRLWPVCATNGVPFSTYLAAQILVLTTLVAALFGGAAALAALAAQVPPADALRLGGTGLAMGVALGGAGAAIAQWACEHARLAERLMLGALGACAAAAALLGILGEPSVIAALALAAMLLLRRQEPLSC